MIKATYGDKMHIVDILSQSFVGNKSVEDVAKQDKKNRKRIRYLMDYSFEVCWNWGEVYLSDDKKGAALLLLPHTQKSSMKAVFLDLKLVFRTIGLSRVAKVMKREKYLKNNRPKTPYLYIWFLGVEPNNQGKGIGSSIIKGIISESEKRNHPIYLETSTKRNLPLYDRFGFSTYTKLDFGYILHMMKREP